MQQQQRWPGPISGLAMVDALPDWFAEPGFRGCMFLKASSDYQESEHTIHAQCAGHKRLLFDHIRALAQRAGARDPDILARHLLLLKEGAIVTVRLGNGAATAQSAKSAAKAILDAALPG